MTSPRRCAVLLTVLTAAVAPLALAASPAQATSSTKPSVKVKASAPSVVLGQAVSVSDKGSKAPKGVSTISFDFGDKTAKASSRSLSTAKTHTYAKVGTYTVKVTLKDKVGKVASAHTTVTVIPVPPVPSPSPAPTTAPAPVVPASSPTPIAVTPTAPTVPGSPVPLTFGPAQPALDPHLANQTVIACSHAGCEASGAFGERILGSGVDWSEETSIDPVERRSVSAISCSYDFFCGEVGPSGQAAIKSGSPLTWSAPTVIDPGHGLTAISCPVTNFCAAVDDAGGAFTWSGGGWSGRTQTAAARLQAVGCADATYCVAGGDTINDTSTTISAYAFVGSTGQWQYLANLYDGTSSGQYAMTTPRWIQCLSKSTCLATTTSGLTLYGDLANSPGVTLPVPTAMQTATPIEGMSCGGGYCALISEREAWSFNNGWVTPVDAFPGTGEWNPNIETLDAIACGGSGECTGLSNNGTARTFTGSSWTDKVPADPTRGVLASLSCPTTTFCMAGDSTGYTWMSDGTTWTGPVLLHTGGGDYIDVSCTSATFCGAVDYRGYAFTWNGSTWTSTTIATPGVMTAISCPVDGVCAAFDNESGEYDLAGGVWTKSTHGTNGYVTGASCPTVTFCAIALNLNGIQVNSGPGTAVNGSASSGGQALHAISCSSANACIAVGFKVVMAGHGATWKTLSGGPVLGMLSISCASDSLCVGTAWGSGATYSVNASGFSAVTHSVPDSSDDNRTSCVRGTTHCTIAAGVGPVFIGS